MSTYVRDTATKLLTIGLNQVLVNNFTLFDWVYPRQYSVATSDKYMEEDYTMHGPPTIPLITEGQNYPEGSVQNGEDATYTHDEYAMILRWGLVAKEDNKYNFISKMGPFLTNAMRNTREMSGASYLNAASTTTGPDGVYLLSTSHPSYDGVWANCPSPAVDLCYSALGEAKAAIKALKSWEGIPIVSPDKIILVTGTALDKMGTQLLGNEDEPFSSDNTINYVMGTFQHQIDPWITDDDLWLCLAQPNGEGLRWFDRVLPSMREFVDNRNGDTCILIRTRYSRGLTDIRRAILYGSPGI